MSIVKLFAVAYPLLAVAKVAMPPPLVDFKSVTVPLSLTSLTAA